MAVDRRTETRRCNAIFDPHWRLQDGEERKEGSIGELTLGEAQPGRSFGWLWRTTVRDGGAASPWEFSGVSSSAREHWRAQGEGGSSERSEAVGRGWVCTWAPKGSGVVVLLGGMAWATVLGVRVRGAGEVVAGLTAANGWSPRVAVADACAELLVGGACQVERGSGRAGE